MEVVYHLMRPEDDYNGLVGRAERVSGCGQLKILFWYVSGMGE
jgi:hypothetical protein